MAVTRFCLPARFSRAPFRYRRFSDERATKDARRLQIVDRRSTGSGPGVFRSDLY